MLQALERETLYGIYTQYLRTGIKEESWWESLCQAIQLMVAWRQSQKPQRQIHDIYFLNDTGFPASGSPKGGGGSASPWAINTATQLAAMVRIWSLVARGQQSEPQIYFVRMGVLSQDDASFINECIRGKDRILITPISSQGLSSNYWEDSLIFDTGCLTDQETVAVVSKRPAGLLIPNRVNNPAFHQSLLPYGVKWAGFYPHGVVEQLMLMGPKAMWCKRDIAANPGQIRKEDEKVIGQAMLVSDALAFAYPADRPAPIMDSRVQQPPNRNTCQAHASQAQTPYWNTSEAHAGQAQPPGPVDSQEEPSAPTATRGRFRRFMASAVPSGMRRFRIFGYRSPQGTTIPGQTAPEL